MATFAVWHPDIEDFIKAKRMDGVLRQFNLSLLITSEFMDAVINDEEWDLVFPVKSNEDIKGVPVDYKELFWEEDYCIEQGYIIKKEFNKKWILCKIYKTIRAKDLWDTIMNSTYDFAEPGFLLIDVINRMNNNYFCEVIRATNPCKIVRCMASS